MFEQIYIVRKLNFETSPQVQDVVDIVVNAASDPFSRMKIISDLSDVDSRTLVIAVGGDGTMLEAMRIAARTGAIATGINLGKVGFLTDFANTKSLRQELVELFHDPKPYPIERRMSISTMFHYNRGTDSGPPPMFNEFVLSNVISDEIITYHLKIDDVDAGYHKANAIIIGTPTGSTAYTLSNGGALLYPSMNVMQIVPVAPLSLSSRPIIVPGISIVTITAETEGSLSLRGDGQRICTYDNGKAEVNFSQYYKYTRVLHTRGWNFFDMLTNKLHWKKE